VVQSSENWARPTSSELDRWTGHSRTLFLHLNFPAITPFPLILHLYWSKWSEETIQPFDFCIIILGIAAKRCNGPMTMTAPSNDDGRKPLDECRA
jgi:hypothetical protein